MGCTAGTSQYLGSSTQLSSALYNQFRRFRIARTTIPTVNVADGVTAYNDLENPDSNTSYSRTGIDCTIKKLWVYIYGNATTASSTFALQADGSNKAEITIPASTTGYLEVDGLSNTIDKDDGLRVKTVNGGGGTLQIASWGCILEATS